MTDTQTSGVEAHPRDHAGGRTKNYCVSVWGKESRRVLGNPSLPLSQYMTNYLVDGEKVRKFQPLDDYVYAPKTERSLVVEQKDSNNTASTLPKGRKRLELSKKRKNRFH